MKAGGRFRARCCMRRFARVCRVALRAASAQDWPSRNVTVVVPLGAGSASDIVARVVMEQVGKQVGQTFVIENRPGAGGTIGANMVAKAAPDGTPSWSMARLRLAHALYSKLPYDTLNDFIPVIALGQQPLAVVVVAGEGLQDARRSGRRRQGQARRAELLDGGRRLGLALRRRALARERRLRGAAHSVQGRAKSVTEIIAGRVDFSVQPFTNDAGADQDGKLAALAVSASKRSPLCRTCRRRSRRDCRRIRSIRSTPALYLPAKTPRAHRREAARRDRQGAAGARGAGALRELGVEPMPMTVAAVRQVLQGRRRGQRRAGEGGENPDAVARSGSCLRSSPRRASPMVALISPPT